MLEQKSILIADDDFEDKELIAEALNEVGMPDTMQFVDNGEEAINYLESLSADQLPRLIVLDLNMPRLSGSQVLNIIKKDGRFKHITVVMYSTSINPIEKKSCMDAGAHAYVTKPSLYKESLETAEYFKDLCLAGTQDN